MKWVIIKGVRYPSSVISAFAAYNNVFYYCNGIESLKSLVEYGVGEFIVIDCWSFFSIDNL